MGGSQDPRGRPACLQLPDQSFSLQVKCGDCMEPTCPPGVPSPGVPPGLVCREQLVNGEHGLMALSPGRGAPAAWVPLGWGLVRRTLRVGSLVGSAEAGVMGPRPAAGRAPWGPGAGLGGFRCGSTLQGVRVTATGRPGARLGLLYGVFTFSFN